MNARQVLAERLDAAADAMDDSCRTNTATGALMHQAAKVIRAAAVIPCGRCCSPDNCAAEGGCLKAPEPASGEHA